MAGLVWLAPAGEVLAAQLVGVLSDEPARSLQSLDVGVGTDAQQAGEQRLVEVDAIGGIAVLADDERIAPRAGARDGQGVLGAGSLMRWRNFSAKSTTAWPALRLTRSRPG